MTNSIIPFDFNGSAVRVVMLETQPWFVAKDVCDVLEIGNARDAISSLDEDEKNTVGIADGIHQGRGNPNMNVISESGLYALIFKSRKEEAKKFRKWVTSEVLPALRRDGSYECPAVFSDPSLNLPEAALHLKPALRTTAMNTAMQMVKHTGGSLESFDSLYFKYCALLAAKPGPVMEPEGLPPRKGLNPAMIGPEPDELMFQDWVVKRLSPALTDGERASNLYHDFTAYCRKHNFNPPNMRRWGCLMTERFDKFKSGYIHYCVGLNGPIGQHVRKCQESTK